MSLAVQGYKRFACRSEMKVDGNVVAIVGPNEAGKTSFLQAVTHLSRPGQFAAGERTRGGSEALREIVSARYILDSEDRAGLGAIPGLEDARWYVEWKGTDGRARHRIEPEASLHRDLRPRRAARENLRRASEHRVVRAADSDEETPTLGSELARLSERLSTTQETLPGGLLSEVESLAGRLPADFGSRAPKYVNNLRAQLEALFRHEEAEHPRDTALQFLDEQRRPQFLLFSTEERDLRSEYDLSTEAHDPRPALVNLAQLANLDLRRLWAAVDGEQWGDVETLVERANDRLALAFEDAWRQSGVVVRLTTDHHFLRILISATGGGYTTIAERSDGLRAFIALLTFTALHSERKPVLLIDEAEAHLHYDAQADLTRVFARQEAAASVIYSTHSAGCLPEDLGAVRVIVPASNGTSEIRNAFWSDGPGLSPLLIGMGASALAFTPARRAVICEGGADVVLFPRLFREAAGIEDVGFQVAPGLSEVRPRDIPALDLEAAQIAYLVDGDRDGRKIEKKLRAAGVPSDRIARLAEDEGGLVLEDLIAPEAYRQAVNRELARSHGSGTMMPASALGQRNRPAAASSWCSRQGIRAPNKVAVAYRVLDLAAEGEPIVDPSRRAVLSKLHTHLAATLG